MDSNTNIYIYIMISFSRYLFHNINHLVEILDIVRPFRVH